MHASHLLPHLTAFRIADSAFAENRLILDIMPKQRCTTCSLCGRRTRRIHSRYVRSVALNRVLPGPSWLVAIFGYLGLINLLLAAFSLIPAFPVDGGRVLHSIMWAITHNSVRATRTASIVGEGFGWIFILGGLFLLFTGNLVNGI